MGVSAAGWRAHRHCRFHACVNGCCDRPPRIEPYPSRELAAEHDGEWPRARIMEVVEAQFGPYARISCTDAVINNLGCGRGYWHANWPYADAPLHLSTIWMLSDFRPDNGATLIVPGSHRLRDNPAAGQLEGIDNEHSPQQAAGYLTLSPFGT